MKALKISLLVVVVLAVLAAVTLYSGLLDFAADQPHSSLTTRLIEIARERSVAGGSRGIKVPDDLGDAAVIAAGAGEYAEMCTGCHLAPGMKDTELRAGLYPKPPNLAEHGAHRSAEQQFWIIKHGLKLSGMPAWGLTHDDARLWSMVAFLRKLPELTPEAYHDLAGSGGGHHHEDMEEGEHSHEDAGDGEAHEHDGAPEGAAPAAPPAHEHPPGTAPHEHQGTAKLPAPAAPAAAAVDSFQASLASGDTSAASELLDAAVLIFESGEAERSRAEYASHHLPADAKFLKGAKVRVLSRTGNATGDLAWVASESEIATAGDKPMKLVATETMILKREAQGWRIQHIHWSSRPE